MNTGRNTKQEPKVINFKCAVSERFGNVLLHPGDELSARRDGKYWWVSYTNNSVGPIAGMSYTFINLLAGKTIITMPEVEADLEDAPTMSRQGNQKHTPHRLIKLSLAGAAYLRERKELKDLAQEILNLTTQDDLENLTVHARLINRRLAEEDAQ
jgi:hypothetical protein